MAATLMERGYRIVSGGTDNHLFLVDLIDKDITGKDADAALGRANITVNKNSVPNDPRSPFVTSGLRMGTPAVTTRGFGLEECRTLAGWIADVLDDIQNEDVIRRVREQVLALCPASRSTAETAAGPLAGGRIHALPLLPARGDQGHRLAAGRQRAAGASARECLACDERFTTFETAELVLPRLVKRDDRREPFDEGKLRAGVMRALEKRPVAAEAVEEAISRILQRLLTAGEREVPSNLVGQLVMDELRQLDEVAYVRFASVYRSFQDVEEFRREIERLRDATPVGREQMSLLPREGK
jgi:transcriptional repressor NrdR